SSDACRLLGGEKGSYLMRTLGGGGRISDHRRIRVIWHGISYNAQISWRGRRCFHDSDGLLKICPVDASSVMHVIYPVPELEAGRDGVSRCSVVGTIPPSVCPRGPIFWSRRQIEDPVSHEDCKYVFQRFRKRGIVYPLLTWPWKGIGWRDIVILPLDRHRPGLLGWICIGRCWCWHWCWMKVWPMLLRWRCISKC